MKKILVFAETERAARKAAVRFGKPDVAVGYRTFAAFNPESPEPCDEAHIIGNNPAIAAAYSVGAHAENLETPAEAKKLKKNR